MSKNQNLRPKFYKIINPVFKFLIETFIFNRNLRAKFKSKFAKRYLKKYVDNAIQYKSDRINLEENNIIWQYWHDGEENAPLIIKKCFESIRNFMPNYKQIIISFNTIKDYVELPQRYYDLLEKGKISRAHFSDVLRVYLLSKYGGTWVDSTIYLTDKIPDDIMNSSFCVLQKDPHKDNQENKMSCFFIHAKGYSEHIAMLKRILDSYWAENDYVINYFMFEHISTMLSDRTPELKTEWELMPYYNAKELTEPLQLKLFEDFDEKKWLELTNNSSIHKLTYKKLTAKTSGKTYYDYIVNH